MKTKFWIATCVLCAFFLLWGELEAYGQDNSNLPNAPSASHKDFRELPPYYYQPFRPLHFLYAIHEHPRRTQIIWMIGAGIAGGLIAWETRAHCDHYEYGQSGVNVNCPKEHGK